MATLRASRRAHRAVPVAFAADDADLEFAHAERSSAQPVSAYARILPKKSETTLGVAEAAGAPQTIDNLEAAIGVELAEVAGIQVESPVVAGQEYATGL